MSEKMELPKGWSLSSISEIAEINPKIPNRECISTEYEVQFLPMKLVEEITNRIHLTETRKYADVLKGSYTPFIDGDIVFAKVTPCMENGKVAIVDNLKNGIGFGSSEFHVIRARKQVLPEYIFNFLVREKFRNNAAKAMTGAVGLRRVPKQFIENHPIPLPPLAEQHRIVAKIEELFSSLDKGIESLKTAQAQLKVYRQAVLKWAFEGKLTNENVKDGELPEGWKWEKLVNVSEITSSKRIFQHEYVSEGIPFYRTKEIKELSEGERPTFDLYISNDKYKEIKARFPVPKSGEVLLSAVGTIGVSYVIKDDKPFYFKDGNLMWFKELNGINPYYLSFGLTSFIRNKKGAKTSGSAYNALTIETMKEFCFPLPSIGEQIRIIDEIEKRLSVCDKLEESITQSLSQAEALRQSILKKAFEGKLVPQDPSDEPASVLLEKIKTDRALRQAQGPKAVVSKKVTTARKRRGA